MGKLVVLVALMLCLPISAGNISKKLPDFTNLTRHGCVIEGPILKTDHNDPAGTMRTVWVVTVWAEHKGPFSKKSIKDWKLWYSDRTKRMKAFADCDRWLEKVSKQVKALRSTPR